MSQEPRPHKKMSLQIDLQCFWLISKAQKVFGDFQPLQYPESLMPDEEEVMEFSTPMLQALYGTVLQEGMIDLLLYLQEYSITSCSRKCLAGY